MDGKKTLARRLANLNPVTALGNDFRHKGVNFPKLPTKPPAVDGTVVIPGGKRPANHIPKGKI